MVAALAQATDEELRIMEAALLRATSKAASRGLGRFTVAQRQAWLRDHLTRYEEWMRKLKAAQAPWYDDLEAEVLANLKAHAGEFASKAGVGDLLEVLLFDDGPAGDALALALRPLYRDAYEQCGQAAIDAAGGGGGAGGGGINFDLDNPRAMELLKARELEMKTVAANAQERCRSSLTEGLANGETIDQMTDRVREWAETGREAYAENVARTETGIVLNESAREGYQQAGMIGTEWLSVIDDRSRPDHADLDGEVRLFGETFATDNGEFDGPGDPAMGPEDVCQCRCTVAAVFGEAD